MQNSQPFTVTGITSTYYGRIQNFRLRTLGVPVRNSDSREASRNSLTSSSSKLELRFFFFSHRDVYVWQLQHLHWEFQCNYANFENILEIPLTLIKQTCSTRSIWRVRARIWCSLMVKVGRKAAQLERVKLQTEIIKEQSELRRKRLEKRVKMASKGGKGTSG